MNGATALPWLKTIRRLKSNIIKTMGPSHHFLRSFINPQNSERIENLLPLGEFIAKILTDALRVVKFGSALHIHCNGISQTCRILARPVAPIQRKSLSEADVGLGQLIGQDIPRDAGQNSGHQSQR